MNYLIHAFLVLTLFSSGCTSQMIDWHGLEKSEKAFQKSQRETVIAYMSPKTMFPDPQVRALAIAASRGDIKKIDQLVKQGVDVNARGTSGATPLFPAMANVRGFEHLLELGADPNVLYGENGKNGSIMHFAVMHKNPEILKLALQYGGDPNLPEGATRSTPIFEAMGPDHKDKIPILIAAGANIDARELNGDTPVMVAAELSQYDTVYDLLQRGADYTIKNRFTGNTLADVIAFDRRTIDRKSNGFRWMEKVIAWLSQEGVEIPEWHDSAKR